MNEHETAQGAIPEVAELDAEDAKWAGKPGRSQIRRFCGMCVEATDMNRPGSALERIEACPNVECPLWTARPVRKWQRRAIGWPGALLDHMRLSHEAGKQLCYGARDRAKWLELLPAGEDRGFPGFPGDPDFDEV